MPEVIADTSPLQYLHQTQHLLLLPLLPAQADLGLGEREVLALASRDPGALALLDDAQARRHAQTAGVAFTGTLGVLLKAKQEGRLPSLAPVLARLQVLGFYLDASTRDAALTSCAGRQPYLGQHPGQDAFDGRRASSVS